jgi:VirB8 protein
VQVDKLGQAQSVAPATADYHPTDPQIAWHLAQFIDEVRSIPPIPSFSGKTGSTDAYNYVTDKGALALMALVPWRQPDVIARSFGFFEGSKVFALSGSDAPRVAGAVIPRRLTCLRNQFEMEVGSRHMRCRHRLRGSVG